MSKHTLTHTCEERIKFSEVDSMQILWHGHYLRLFEEGREQFGIRYNLDYLTVYNSGFFTPIVSSSIKHLAPLQYGDTAIIKTTYTYTLAAKIVFAYKIYSKKTGALSATGETVQVFLDIERNLVITNPAYYEDWKRKYFIYA